MTGFIFALAAATAVLPLCAQEPIDGLPVNADADTLIRLDGRPAAKGTADPEVLPSQRSATEDTFIATLRAGAGSRAAFEAFPADDLEPYADNLYVLPGDSYLNKEITRNVYLVVAEDAVSPVWSDTLPAESMANLFVYPFDGYPRVNVDVTVLKHEYGQKETVTTPLDCLIATCESDGCKAFWGVEKIEDGMLQGSLFMYNPTKNYDHVFKIECRPADVIAGKGRIKARASLFVPTDNVHNLYAPHIRKTEQERIKYETE